LVSVGRTGTTAALYFGAGCLLLLSREPLVLWANLAGSPHFPADGGDAREALGSPPRGRYSMVLSHLLGFFCLSFYLMKPENIEMEKCFIPHLK